MSQHQAHASSLVRGTAIVVLACLGPSAAIGESSPPPTNLARNPSFEQAAANSALPAEWYGTPQVYSLDAAVARSGKASLKYVNRDPQRYVLCTQKVPVQPGWKCRVSAWIKTQDLAGDESGATICLEWQGKDGKWLGGVYPTGIKGTRDWTRVEAITRLPDDAASCHVACYVRQGMTGTAWFDDVELVRIADPPMQTVLLSPNYRGRITAAGPQDALVRVRWNLVDYDLKPQEIQVAALLGSRGKNALRHTPDLRRADREGCLDLSCRWPAWSRASTTWRSGWKGRTARNSRPITIGWSACRKHFAAQCVIDEHRRLLVDGQPFFPIGMYWSSINAKDLEVYAQSKFNCLMPYGSPTQQQMDLAQEHGLKVIYSIKDWYAGSEYCPESIRSEADEEPQVRARVRQFRDHPALLAWYLNDELPQQYMPRLEAHQRWVAEEDPDHPTWVVLYQFREVAAYLKTFDVIGTDPYPIGRSPASMAAQWTAETFRQVERPRPLWQVPQLHNWANYAKTDAEKKRGRTPTFDEVRSMAWQCICEGATGLVFYSWFDVRRNPDVPFDVQWDGLKRWPPKSTAVAHLAVGRAGAGGHGRRGPPDWLHWLARVHAASSTSSRSMTAMGKARSSSSCRQPPRHPRAGRRSGDRTGRNDASGLIAPAGSTMRRDRAADR